MLFQATLLFISYINKHTDYIYIYKITILDSLSLFIDWSAKNTRSIRTIETTHPIKTQKYAIKPS